MAYRTEIELALDEMISDETGMKFQGVAVIHAQSEMAQLNACERKKDGGLDAHAEGVSQPDERKTPHVVCGSHLSDGEVLMYRFTSRYLFLRALSF